MRQSNKMRIVLKKDWDININPPTDNRQVQGFLLAERKSLNY